jgi:Sulfatase
MNSLRSIIAWVLAGLIGGVAIGLTDALILVTQARMMFFDTREAVYTAAWAFGIICCCSISIVTLAGIVTEIGIRSFRRLGWLNRSRSVSICIATLVSPALLAALWHLTSGPQASQLPARPFILGIVSFLLALIAVHTTLSASRWSAQKINRRRLAAASALSIAGLCYLVDMHVLVRLYSLFHLLLSIGLLLVLGIGIRIWLGPIIKTWSLCTVITLAFLGITWGCISYYKTSRTQNPRFVINERTPTAADLFTLAAHLTSPHVDKSTDLEQAEQSAHSLPTIDNSDVLRPGADLFLITIDAMRFDRLTSLGAKRVVAPVLDRLAAQSIVFSRAYSPIPHTSYALSSLMTGKYTNSLFDIPGVAATHETWPQIMHRFRYDSAAFFTPAIFFIDRARFEPYLRMGYGFSYRKVEHRMPASARVKQLITFLKERESKENPVFAWSHFFEPHEPYESSCTRFGTSNEDRYDCEIWTVDKALEELFAYLDEAYPHAIIIVTADHGEEFDDHGGRYHGTTLYDEQVRVPLIIRIPKMPAKVVDTPVGLVDLLGTTLSLLDIPIPARVRSRDLSQLIAGADSSHMGAFSEVHEESMLVSNNHKLICNFKQNLCRLYDLVNDPKETRSCSRDKPDVLRKMKSRLRAWRSSHARHELRPVITSTGTSKWPDSIRRALALETDVLDELVETIVNSGELSVKRKAAELVYSLADADSYGAINRISDEEDDETLAWLASLRFKYGDNADIETLDALSNRLGSDSLPWREMALLRLEAGQVNAVSDVLLIADNDQAPVEVRLRAIRLLGEAGKPRIADTLLKHINTYQLALEIAAAVGKLRYRPAVPTLITRLKRERFTQRKSAIINALMQIGDKRAAGPIATELFLETPPDGALEALASLKAANGKGKDYVSPDSDKTVVVYLPSPNKEFVARTKKATRLIVKTTAKEDGGSVDIICNGKAAQRIGLLQGSNEAFVDLDNCNAPGDQPLRLKIRTVPNEIEATVDVIGLIGI